MIINKKEYNAKNTEFFQVNVPNYETLHIFPNVGVLERKVGLINDLKEDLRLNSITIIGDTHGSFVSKNINFESIHIYDNTALKEADLIYISENTLLTDEMYQDIQNFENSIILSPTNGFFSKPFVVSYPLTKLIYEQIEYSIYIPHNLHKLFYDAFKYYITENNIFDYNNLINLCIMVKNAGTLFEKVLTENLPIVDRWTILDTGSTDNTIESIYKVLSTKKGKLYQEPFINFRDSRNRCLELAGKKCKYNVMLDDTYVVRGDLRKFLSTIRGDQFGDSYSLIVQSDDVEYSSNRVLKTENDLKYIYKIHEVIQKDNNVNVVIPKVDAYIYDYRADYMEKRTMDRKRDDLKLLFEEINENPNDPRNYYYIGQTYNLLEEHELATEYFIKRYEHPNEGFLQEKIDALFEATRNYNFKLNKPWEECEKLYLKCYEMDKSRPDSLYFIGIHYYLEKDYSKAYPYLKTAYQLGYPLHAQFSLKPTLSFHFVPKFLCEVCYFVKDYQTGLECARFFLQNNKKNEDYYSNAENWHSIFFNLVNMKVVKDPITSNKKIICFVADGGYNKWSGKDILLNGVGGSETFIIEISRYIKSNYPDYRVIVFCDCEKDMFEGVEYIPLKEFSEFVSTTSIHTCLVSRFSQYIPMCIEGHVENIYFILHDVSPIGNIIPIHPKLKKILCLTEWHKSYFLSSFPQFTNMTDVFSYGIEPSHLDNTGYHKVPYSFIYSSFPNRGLLTLLKMWSRIKQVFPYAVLNIYSDVNGEWVNQHYPEEMKEIKSYLWNDDPSETYKGYEQGIVYHGWVSKSQLKRAWAKADFWLYPCKFAETFCLTALEAAASKTLAITNNLAALNDTVGDRGIVIPGDSTREEWQDDVIRVLSQIKDNTIDKQEYINKNHNWASQITWESRSIDFMKKYVINDDINQIEQVKEGLNYMGMYNWTNDIPKDSRKIFESILKHISSKSNSKKIDILEIGTYTGTSVIEMLNILDHSYATVIDMWEDYDESNSGGKVDILANMKINKIENIFYENIISSGVQNRIEVVKGDSTRILLNFVGNRLYDFIYVDGSHKCLDCYSDMVLSWKLLKKGGVLGVDDYMYNLQDSNNLNMPYHAVEHFMQKYKGEYKLLDKGYRVFLEKLE